MEGNHLKTISKTEDELRVANYMVLFGGKDLADEYFTSDTEFESEYTKTGMLYVDWEHGMDWNDPESPQRDDILGYVDWKTAKKDERGLWVERVLSRRNDYMAYLEELIEEDLIGTSSEAVGGKVRKTADGEIQIWPLKRDALTVTPAEPRMMSENAIGALKALSEYQPNLKAFLQSVVNADEGDGADGDKDENTTETVKTEYGGISIMDAKELDKTLKAMQERLEILEAPPEETTDESVSDQLKVLTDLIMNSSKAKDGGYTAPDDEDTRPEVKSFGDYLVAIRRGNTRRLKNVYGAKTALAEEAGATGGYLVPEEYGGVIMAQVGQLSVLRAAGAQIVPMARKTREIAVLDVETAPSAGDTAYAGGAIAYWIEEAASITESEPRFRLIDLTAHKLAGLAYASSEVRDDAAESVDGIIAMSFSRAIAAKENYAFFRGDGVGKPRGILECGAWSAQSRSAANTVALADLAIVMSAFLPESLNARSGAWFMNPSLLQEVVALADDPLSWMPNMREAGVPGFLMGFPVYFTGALPALDTAGDIMLVDPKYYYIGDRSGIEIGASEHYKYANDQWTYRVIKRVDGRPILDSTITLENASTTVSPYVGLAAG